MTPTISTPWGYFLYNLSLSVDKTHDLLLVNWIWQRWRMSLTVKLHYVRLCLSRWEQAVSLKGLKKQPMEGATWWGAAPTGRPQGGLQPKDSHRERNSASVILTEFGSRFFPNRVSRWKPSLAHILTAAFETKQRICLLHARIPESWQVSGNKYACCFELLTLW